MTLCPTSTTLSGAAGFTVNVPRDLRDLFFPVRLRAPCRIHNRPPVPVSAGATSPRPQRDGAVPPLHGLAVETIDWATAVLAQRAATAAEQLVPGVSIVHRAWRMVGFLSAARQGRLLDTLRTVPVDMLVPAAMMASLRGSLQQVLPGWLSELPDPEDAVLSIGLGALAYSLARTQTRSAEAGLAVAWMRRLRAALNIARSLHPLRNGDIVAPSARRALAGPLPAMPLHTSSPAPAGNQTHDAARTALVQRVFPRASGDLRMLAEAAPPHGSAWPLPGIGADKGRPPPVAKIAHKVAATLRKTGFHISQKVRAGARTRNQNQNRHRHRHGTGRRWPERTKERLMPSPEHPGRADAAAQGRRDRKRTEPAGNVPPVLGMVPAAKANGTSASLPDVPAAPAHHAAAGKRIPFTPSEFLLPVPMPACLQFHDSTLAWKQVGDALFERSPVRFCVHPLAAETFELVFSRPRVGRGSRQECMVSIALREEIPEPLRTAAIRRQGGPGQDSREVIAGPAAVGDDEIYAIATVSRLDARRLRTVPLEGTRLLLWNSFKLLQHAGLGGGGRLLLAYALNPPRQPEEMRVGLLEVQQDERGYSVTDEQTGYSFTGDTLKDLVVGLQHISGCHFHVDAHAPVPAVDTLEEVVPLQHTPHLFVHDDRSLQHPVPRFNPSLSFFSPVPFYFLEGLVGGVLYRGCFTHVGGTLVFVDTLGELGTLQFSSTDPQHETYTLERHQGTGRAFIDGYGLQEGHRYRMCEVVELLQGQGMVWMAYSESEGDGQADACPPEATTSVQGGTGHGMPAASARVQAGSPPLEKPPALPARSTYVFDNRQMLYVDHDGSQGVLNFVNAGPEGKRRALADDNTHAAILFAGHCGLVRGRHYTVNEVLERMAAAGMVGDVGLLRTFDYQAQSDSMGPREWGVMPRQ